MLTEEQKIRRRVAAKRYYEKNKDQVREKGRLQQKKWREENREAHREQGRIWRAANPERSKALHNAYYARVKVRDPERVITWSRKRRGLPEPTRSMPEFCENCAGARGPKRLAIDHCHITGAFRGWLCDNCNTGLGKLGDTKAGLLRALEYLERFECQTKSQSPAPEPPSTLET